MTFIEEMEIKQAMLYNDGRLLAQTVKRMAFPDFEAVNRVVRSMPGGYDLDDGEIKCGTVRVRSEGGKIKMEEGKAKWI